MQMTLEDIAEEVNEKHVVPWGDACLREGINNTPLTPIVAEVSMGRGRAGRVGYHGFM